MPLTISLDMAAEKTWARGQFSPYREWYGRSMYNTYPIPTETPICAKCYQRGRDAVKLTVKRIIKESRVANFQDEYAKISFWELWGWITAFKIIGEKFILIENTFLSENLR